MIERERYVPQGVREIVESLTAPDQPDAPMSDAEFETFCRLLSALYHVEFHERERSIVQLWREAVADRDAAERLATELTGLLDGANYTALTMDDLEHALQNESLIPLHFSVDLDDYDELLVYRRGSHRATVDVPRWKGLRRPEQRTITVDERVVVHTRVKSADWFATKGVDPVSRNLEPGQISLKHFEDVPRADIEMLLPSTQVKFRPIDRLLMGGGAVISAIIVLFTKLLSTVGLILLLFGAWLGLRDETPELDQAALVLMLTGVVTLGLFGFRQWNNLKNRRVEYLKMLSEHLYFRTLGNGAGVLHSVLAAAEEQEIAEVLLGYWFLLSSPRAIGMGDLDQRVEAWLAANGDRPVDFEVDDAVAKLERLRVVIRTDDLLSALPLSEAIPILGDRWNSMFAMAPDPAELSQIEHPVPDDSSAAHADDGGLAPLIRLRRVVDRFRSRLGERTSEREGEE